MENERDKIGMESEAVMKLHNNQIEVEFTTKGGEMTSLTSKKTGIQYLWQGSDAYWTGKNPTLFPMVGNTFSGTYEIDGKEYQMKNHGLIRYADLECVNQSDTSITFQLKADEATTKQYPFDFVYEITYTLNEGVVEVSYVIRNEGKKTMPFGFGLHPGFNCPILDGEKFEDYHIDFETEEHLQQLISDPKRETPHHYEERIISSIPMDYTTFDIYPTLIYKGMKSSYVTLTGPKHSVKMSIKGYPILAVWTYATGAPFVCIEPWYSHGDFEKNDLPFEKREGTMLLEPGKEFTTSYTIEVF